MLAIRKDLMLLTYTDFTPLYVVLVVQCCTMLVINSTSSSGFGFDLGG